MAESQISTPDVGTVALATDEIDGRHHQAVKVYGGGEGVANELAVSDEGEIRTIGKLVGGFGVVPIGETGYADKALIGGLIPLVTGARAGLYNVDQIAILLADFVTPAPSPVPLPPIRFGLLSVSAGNDVSAVNVDGFDLTTASLDFVQSFQWLPSAVVFDEAPPSPGLSVALPNVTVFFNEEAPGDTSDVYAVLMADGAIVTDLTAYSVAVQPLFTMKAVG